MSSATAPNSAPPTGLPDPERPYVKDATIEEGLVTVAKILSSERNSKECRQAIAAGAEVEFSVLVRAHHDGEGFCIVLDKYLRTAPTQVMWRKRLK